MSEEQKPQTLEEELQGIPPGKLVNGQWEGVPLSQFPKLQEEVRKGLQDGTLQVGGEIK